MSKIEWTGRTWNPLVGCTIHSAGCKGCFAMRDAYRLMHNPNPAIAKKFAGTAKLVNGHAVWTGKINFSPEALLAPLRRRVPTVYFVNSLSDLFHQAIPDEQIDLVFAVMALCPRHTFRVLTKRSERMRRYFAERLRDVERHATALRAVSDGLGALTLGDAFEALSRRPHLHNVWLGVSVEDQRSANERIPDLLNTPAAIRFLSCEPLIGPIDLNSIKAPREPDEPDLDIDWRFDALEVGDYYWFDCGDGFSESGDGPYREHRIDWVIAGGESGTRSRPMHPAWVQGLRDQCANATIHGDPSPVPFFFKQWGNWAPRDAWVPGASRQVAIMPDGQRVDDEVAPQDVGGHRFEFVRKGDAGRLLDGVEHNGMPA